MTLAVDTIKHAVLEYEKIENRMVDVVAMLQPTAPLRTSAHIDEACQALIKDGADGLVSLVSVENNHPYKVIISDNSIVHDYVDTGLENPPRQSLPPVYIVNGALYITKRDILVNKNSFKGDMHSVKWLSDQ